MDLVECRVIKPCMHVEKEGPLSIGYKIFEVQDIPRKMRSQKLQLKQMMLFRRAILFIKNGLQY